MSLQFTLLKSDGFWTIKRTQDCVTWTFYFMKDALLFLTEQLGVENPEELFKKGKQNDTQ